jgi:hypothetical protein
MAKPNKNDLVKIIKKISRENQLERDRLIGRPRAKTFGGKPSIQQDRRESKKGLNGLDKGESVG